MSSKIDHWICVNKPSIIFFRSAVMLINNHNILNFSLFSNHQWISKQSSLYYLGIILDVSWKPQVVNWVAQLSNHNHVECCSN